MEDKKPESCKHTLDFPVDERGVYLPCFCGRIYCDHLPAERQDQVCTKCGVREYGR